MNKSCKQDKENIIFNLVFFISVTSILIQGTSIPLVAKWLKLSVPVNLKKKSVLDLELGWKTKSLYNVVLVEPGISYLICSVVPVLQ